MLAAAFAVLALVGLALVGVALVGVALVGVAGCSSAEDEAQRLAVERVRASAENARAAMAELVTAPGAPTGEALLDQIETRLSAGTDVMVLGRRVADRGGVAVQLALHAQGHSGGGGTYTATVARLCVELAGTAGTAVVISDLTCPDGLPATVSQGKVDLTTTLAGS